MESYPVKICFIPTKKTMHVSRSGFIGLNHKTSNDDTTRRTKNTTSKKKRSYQEFGAVSRSRLLLTVT